MTVLCVVGRYLAEQALESYLITPQLQQKAVSMHPALTTAFQLLMGFFFGLLGLALAAPFLAMAVLLMRDHYVPDVIQESHDERGQQDIQSY